MVFMQRNAQSKIIDVTTSNIEMIRLKAISCCVYVYVCVSAFVCALGMIQLACLKFVQQCFATKNGWTMLNMYVLNDWNCIGIGDDIQNKKNKQVIHSRFPSIMVGKTENRWRWQVDMSPNVDMDAFMKLYLKKRFHQRNIRLTEISIIFCCFSFENRPFRFYFTFPCVAILHTKYFDCAPESTTANICMITQANERTNTASEKSSSFSFNFQYFQRMHAQSAYMLFGRENVENEIPMKLFRVWFFFLCALDSNRPDAAETRLQSLPSTMNAGAVSHAKYIIMHENECEIEKCVRDNFRLSHIRFFIFFLFALLNFEIN